MTYQEHAHGARRRLEQAGIAPEAAGVDVAVLARAILGWDAARWLVDGQAEASADFAARLHAWIERRARREPVAYIVGEREFYGRPFLVTPAVLIPRPDTEAVATAALGCLDEMARRAPLVVDVGTGSGCLAITVAAERPDSRLVATDVSRAALAVARENARRLGVSSRVGFREGSLLAGLDDRPDVIISNPPYVRQTDRDTLPADVVEHEPHLALFAGPDGLAVVGGLVEAAARQLVPGGRLVFEIGFDQAESASRLVAAAGLTVVAVERDLGSRPRVVVAERR